MTAISSRAQWLSTLVVAPQLARIAAPRATPNGGSARILPDRTRHSASHDTVARLRAHGAEILGEMAQFESMFLLCYLRGPAGIIVALAEQIG